MAGKFRLDDIVSLLDETFRIDALNEVIGFHRIHEEANLDLRPWVESEFLQRRNGLFLRGRDEVPMICGVVFPSSTLLMSIMTRVPPGTMVFSHHPMDDDFLGRGFLPADLDVLAEFKRRDLSLYYLHLPLDIGRPFNTSSTLADRLELTSESRFFPFQDGTLGVVARSQLTRDDLLQRIKQRLGIARVQTVWHTDLIDPIAVIAGGGDAEEFVVAASEAGCHTYLNGIVHNYVDHPEVQRDNEAFRAAAEKFKINLIGVSHYASEEPAIHRTLELLHHAFELPVHFFPDEAKVSSINEFW